MIRSILVIRNDRFGEFLLNLSAIRALKETFPQAKLTVAVSPLVKELAGAVECIDETVVWDAKFRKNLRKQKFDACVILNPTKEAHWVIFWAGIPIRVGYARKWGFLLTRKLEDTKHLGNRHEVECNLELVGLIGAKNSGIGLAPLGSALPQAFRPRSLLSVPYDNKYDFLAEAIAIHPFTSDPVKQWPLERFEELAQRIARELKLRVVLVGKDENNIDKAIGKEDHKILNLINKTTLIGLAQVLKQCKVLVTCDSGPMHLAAAVGTPVIALFRNDLTGKTAGRWGPWGDGHIVIEKSNLKDINVEEVMKVIKVIVYSK
jgi:ADP-heptose:LPS heptosyltransferase